MYSPHWVFQLLNVSFSASMSSGGGWLTGLNCFVVFILRLTASMACCCSPWATRRATLAWTTCTAVVAMLLAFAVLASPAASVASPAASVASQTAVWTGVRRADRLAELPIVSDPFRLLDSGSFTDKRNHADVVMGRLAGRGCNHQNSKGFHADVVRAIASDAANRWVGFIY